MSCIILINPSVDFLTPGKDIRRHGGDQSPEARGSARDSQNPHTQPVLAARPPHLLHCHSGHPFGRCQLSFSWPHHHLHNHHSRPHPRVCWRGHLPKQCSLHQPCSRRWKVRHHTAGGAARWVPQAGAGLGFCFSTGTRWKHAFCEQDRKFVGLLIL